MTITSSLGTAIPTANICGKPSSKIYASGIAKNGCKFSAAKALHSNLELGTSSIRAGKQGTTSKIVVANLVRVQHLP
jgi:hypothetical protein